jgi:hypothetical protein
MRMSLSLSLSLSLSVYLSVSVAVCSVESYRVMKYRHVAYVRCLNIAVSAPVFCHDRNGESRE